MSSQGGQSAEILLAVIVYVSFYAYCFKLSPVGALDRNLYITASSVRSLIPMQKHVFVAQDLNRTV